MAQVKGEIIIYLTFHSVCLPLLFPNDSRPFSLVCLALLYKFPSMLYPAVPPGSFALFPEVFPQMLISCYFFDFVAPGLDISGSDQHIMLAVLFKCWCLSNLPDYLC